MWISSLELEQEEQELKELWRYHITMNRSEARKNGPDFLWWGSGGGSTAILFL